MLSIPFFSGGKVYKPQMKPPEKEVEEIIANASS